MPPEPKSKDAINVITKTKWTTSQCLKPNRLRIDNIIACHHGASAINRRARKASASTQFFLRWNIFFKRKLSLCFTSLRNNEGKKPFRRRGHYIESSNNKKGSHHKIFGARTRRELLRRVKNRARSGNGDLWKFVSTRSWNYLDATRPAENKYQMYRLLTWWSNDAMPFSWKFDNLVQRQKGVMCIA